MPYEKFDIEILKDDAGKVIDLKGIPCLKCGNLNTHIYADVFFCFDCKNRIEKLPKEVK